VSAPLGNGSGRRPRTAAGRAIACALGLTLALALPAAAAMNVDARLSAATIEAGGTVALILTVTDPKGSVADPQFTLPGGLEQLGSARSQQFSWVNGRSTNQVTFRYEIGATLPGRYSIGPIRVAVGGQTYRSGELPLVVSTTAPPPVPGARGGRTGRADAVASLVVTLEPPQPVVGQACRLRVQLVQRVDMAEDSDYEPPATPGFWTESWGEASRYSAREGRRQVIITERSLRLYPLAPGRAVITPAYAVVTPENSAGFDPFGLPANSRLQIASDSLRVSVHPLPGGAPKGFDGGVGRFELSWSADRSHTTQDQAITARLDVRGAGNLPLLRAPAYAPPDFEVFAATVDDSLPPAGEVGMGRRTFLWTLLPRRAGKLHVAAPTLVWFDPEASRYITSTPGAQDLEVLSARGPAGAEDADGMPRVFREHPARPGGRSAWPPLALAGGLLVALGVVSWRRSQLPDPGVPERARLREWLRSIGLAHGPDFWRAADEVAGWLHTRGDPVLRIREAIQSARYGGRMDQEDEVRARLVERIGAAIPAPPARWPHQAAGALLVAGGLALAVWSLPSHGRSELAERAAAADTRARNGRVDQAEAEWARLWDESPGDPALAARLAWGALQRDDPGAATVWVLRGDRREARDPALRLLAQRVRDAGGLVGAPGRSLPLRSSEWAVLACVLAIAAGVLWPRRRIAEVLLGLALVAGTWWPAESAWRGQQWLAVVRSAVTLPPGDVMLDAGQVVRVLRLEGGQADVRATADLSGTLPERALWFPATR
jgi:hypothetical protein